MASMDEIAPTDVQVLRLGSVAGAERSTTRSPTLHQRLRVRRRRWRLDREIADGYPPDGSQLHALRWRQLADPRVRAAVAADVRRIVDDAEQPYTVLHAVALGHPPGLLRLLSAEVLAYRDGLLGLAERLEAPTAVNPRGVARARLLLADAEGPLYCLAPERSLEETIWWIADGLQDRPDHPSRLQHDREARTPASRVNA